MPVRVIKLEFALPEISKSALFVSSYSLILEGLWEFIGPETYFLYSLRERWFFSSVVLFMILFCLKNESLFSYKKL